MRIVVVGGTGLIGAKLVPLLADGGHDVLAAARETGVNAYTGDGLAAALAGAEVVIDVSNSSYTDELGVLEYFETATLNLLTYGRAAGVRHHVALSVVGTDRLAATQAGYFRAKSVQESLIRASNAPFSIVHVTQFYEFVRSIAESATRAGSVRLAEANIRPMAADDVAAAVADVAVGGPLGGMIEFAGPEVFALAQLVRTQLRAHADPREVVADPLARYFGSALTADELLPYPDATFSSTTFAQWLAAGAAGSSRSSSRSIVGDEQRLGQAPSGPGARSR